MLPWLQSRQDLLMQISTEFRSFLLEIVSNCLNSQFNKKKQKQTNKQTNKQQQQQQQQIIGVLMKLLATLLLIQNLCLSLFENWQIVYFDYNSGFLKEENIFLAFFCEHSWFCLFYSQVPKLVWSRTC